jgi:hypothetical protein
MGRLDNNFDRGGPDRRYFTPEQADKAIVLVSRIVSDIVDRYRRLVDLQEVIEAAQRSGRYDRCRQAQDELVAVAQKIQTCAEELDDVGVELRDWSTGVVDFPCIADGREVYLCWRYGEDRVSFWHECQAPSEERKPLSTLPQPQPVVLAR